jgi:rhodanese-related sulfurtransferase
MSNKNFSNKNLSNKYIISSFSIYLKYKITRMFRLGSPIQDITVQEAKEKYDRGELVFLDLRANERARIEGSIILETQNISKNLSLLPRDKIIVVMCWGGGLSATVTKMLVKKGFANTRNLKGGMTRWALDIDNDLLDLL